MDIFVNGQPHSLDEYLTVDALLLKLGMDSQGIAVAVNERVIPRSLWKTSLLSAQDKVIVIRATAGG